MRHTSAAIIAALLALATLGLVRQDGRPSDEQMQQDHYCEMVEIHDRTNGDAGWPPYRGRELCN